MEEALPFDSDKYFLGSKRVCASDSIVQWSEYSLWMWERWTEGPIPINIYLFNAMGPTIEFVHKFLVVRATCSGK